MKKTIYILTDAHIFGLGAILAQGNTISDAKPVAEVSRTINMAEKKYPQLDLEAMAIDFALRIYLVGAPDITIITDHKLLCAIFNGKKTGSIRTDDMKLRHQDIVFSVEYQKGQINPTDYLSRRGKPFAEIPIEQQKEVDDIKNILYMFHTTPIIDNLGLTRIARKTNKVEILKQLREIIERGPRWIPNTSDACLKKFEQVIPEITLTSNGIILKSERKRKYTKESINIYAQESVNNCLNCQRQTMSLLYKIYLQDTDQLTW